MTDHERLTGQLGRVEQEVEHLQTLNLLLTEEIDRLNRELIQARFDMKCEQQHQKHAPIAALFTEGDAEQIA